MTGHIYWVTLRILISVFACTALIFPFSLLQYLRNVIPKRHRPVRGRQPVLGHPIAGLRRCPVTRILVPFSPRRLRRRGPREICPWWLASHLPGRHLRRPLSGRRATVRFRAWMSGHRGTRPPSLRAPWATSLPSGETCCSTTRASQRGTPKRARRSASWNRSGR
jgi:hypothetical protein